MKLNRREFTGHLVLAGSGLMLAGCPTAQDVFNELDTWVPVAIATFDGIVAFVDSVLTAAAVAVDAAWSILRGAIDAYVHTTDPTKTMLDKVIAALDAVSTQMAAIVAALPSGISANILKAAQLGFALLVATLKDIRGKISPTPAPMLAVANLPTVTPAKSTKDFIAQVNKIMAENNVPLRVK